MPTTTKYIARLNGEIVARRTSKAGRIYAYAVYVTHTDPNRLPRAYWASRLDLAQKEQRDWQTYGYAATILPAEMI